MEQTKQRRVSEGAGKARQGEAYAAGEIDAEGLDEQREPPFKQVAPAVPVALPAV